MATPILAQGTTVSVGDGAASTAVIGGIISMSGIGSGSASEIDVTTLASTAKEFRQGLKDNGSMTFELIRDEDDAGQAELKEMEDAQASREFIITLPTSTLNVFTFTGFVTTLSTEVGADDVVKGSCTVRITGAIVVS
tara:strand:- start:675 stop:1088 length:414 start_codon:yes stop_codon:yes gene_type:complete